MNNADCASVAVRSVFTSSIVDALGNTVLRTRVKLVLPPATVAGKDTVWLTSELETFSMATFNFLFWELPTRAPSIVSFTPERIPLGVPQALRMRVTDVGQINSLRDLTVRLNDIDASVTAVRSFEGYSFVDAIAPPMDIVGTVFVEVVSASAVDNAQFAVEIFNEFEPEVVFFSPSGGSAAGGSVVLVTVKNFPPMSKAAPLTAVVSKNGTENRNATVLEHVADATGEQLVKLAMPTVAESGGVMTVRLAVGMPCPRTRAPLSCAVSFDFVYEALPTGPAPVESTFPLERRFAPDGGDTLQLQLSNFFA